MTYDAAETGLEETLGNSAADSHGVSLTEGARRILYATLGVKLGVAGSYRTPLAELGKFVDGIFTCQSQGRIEHGRHVARVKEKPVAGKPCGVVGVGDKKRRIEYIYEVGTTHGTAGMTGFGLFDHRRSQNTDIVGCLCHKF